VPNEYPARIAGTRPSVETFDVEAALADLDSPEAALLDATVVVSINAGSLLADLLEAFVSVN
jgi:hypothetical protein